MYQIVVSYSAEKDLGKLPSSAIIKVSLAIDSLCENPRPVGCKKLKAVKESLWRIRVGDYRVIYSIAEKLRSWILEGYVIEKMFTNSLAPVRLGN